MKNFSDLIFTPTIEYDDRTLLIQNIPESKRDAKLLKRYIEKKFIGIEATQILFTYGVDILTDLKKQQDTIDSALYYCEKYNEKYNHPLLVPKPDLLGQIAPCIVSKIDATTYYNEQKEEYQLLLKDEVCRLPSQPKHAVFVQLKNELMAQRYIIIDTLTYIYIYITTISLDNHF